MALVAGSYERFLFGFTCPQEGAPPAAGGAAAGAEPLARAFTYAAHKGVVKCLAAGGRFLASGGADDLIHIYDLHASKDLGFLINPEAGAVTALAFFTPPGAYTPTHLLSGSEEGGLSVWAAGGGWECMRTLAGHRKAISAIAVHPSGRLALTVARDCALRMWNLVKGKCTFIAKLETEAEGVAFSPSGDAYALRAGPRVSVHSVGADAAAGPRAVLDHPSRVLCMAYGEGDGVLLTGAEDGSLRVWDCEAGVELLCVSRAHATRIRGIALLLAGEEWRSGAAAGAGARAGVPPLVATAASDGTIKVWDLRQAAAAAAAPASKSGGGSGGAVCVWEANTRARLTVLCATDPPAVMRSRLHEEASAAGAAQRAKHKRAREGEGAAAAEPRGKKGAGQPKPGKSKKGAQEEAPAAAAGGKRAKQGAQAPPQKQQQQQAKKGGAQQGKQQPGKPQPGGAMQQQQQQAKAPPAAAAAAAGGGVAKDGVVEFVDDADRAREAKRQRKVSLQRERKKEKVKRGKRRLPGGAAEPGDL